VQAIDIAIGCFGNYSTLIDTSTHRKLLFFRAGTALLQFYRKFAQRDPRTYLPNVAMTLNILGDLYRDTARRVDAHNWLRVSEGGRIWM
jgi:hypothetical protein